MRMAQRKRLAEGTHNFSKGHPVSEELRNKLRIVHSGRKASIATREKMRSAHLALSRKGEKRSDAARLRMSLAHLGKKQSPELIKKRADALRGHKQSPETIAKRTLGRRRPILKPDESKIWKNRIEYKNWRKAVFERDNWTCQKYKERGGELHPHHVRNFAEHSELRFDVNNGITLSVKAHREFHKIYGKRGNTLAQIEEFLKA